MNHVGAWLAGGLTLIVIAVIGIFSFLPTESPAPAEPAESVLEPVAAPVVAAPVLDQAQLEANLAQREGIYQGQVAQLDQTIQQRQQTYQEQLHLLNGQVGGTQEQLAALQAQEQVLADQVAQLEAARAERLNQYQAQLSQAQTQYSSRFNDLQTQLAQIQSRLVEANAQLGR
ncbi:MAG: hypothetical protein KDF65_13870 [Anaerolineae bacterium]|nr:hypothetical protein [Anaerolineae bacterium]